MSDELWFVVPPGWIELAAHADDAAAVAWFDRLLARTPDLLSVPHRDQLREAFVQTRVRLPVDQLGSAGLLLTSWEDGDGGTVWQYTVDVMVVPGMGELNLMAVLERFLSSDEGKRPMGDGDFVETFQTPAKRDGVAVFTTAEITDDDGTLARHLPAIEPSRLGVVTSAVRLGRSPGSDDERILLVTGVAPNVDQRWAMALIAANIAATAQVRDSDDDPLPGRIDVDATGHGRDLDESSR